ncbi:MAG: neuromedin U [Myxococcota bacterium]
MFLTLGKAAHCGALLLLTTGTAHSSAPGSTEGNHGASSLPVSNVAAASQNPVADLASLPFQLNLQYGVGPEEGFAPLLNIQPVLPVRLSQRLLLITRAIVPLLALPAPSSTAGIGDLNLSWFLSPPSLGPLTLGFGPAVILPTASSSALGRGLLFVGGTGVGVLTLGPIVAGALASHSYAIPQIPDEGLVQNSAIQPFLNWNGNDGWFLTSSPLIIASATAGETPQWTVPIGGGAGRVFRLLGSLMSAQMGGYWNLVAPAYGPRWSLRLSLAFLFPTTAPSAAHTP